MPITRNSETRFGEFRVVETRYTSGLTEIAIHHDSQPDKMAAVIEHISGNRKWWIYPAGHAPRAFARSKASAIRQAAQIALKTVAA